MRLFFITVLIVCGSSANAQIDTPLSVSNMFDFDTSALRLKRIKEIRCTEIAINTDSMVIDTMKSHKFVCNDKHRLLYCTALNRKTRCEDSCFFVYKNGKISEERYVTHAAYRGKDGKPLKWYFTYRYSNEKLVSTEHWGLYEPLNKVVQWKYDTFIYQKNTVISKEYRRSPYDESVVDSVIRKRMYDKKGNLVRYSIHPSTTFNRFHHIFQTYAIEHMVIYNYTDVKKISVKFKSKKKSVDKQRNIYQIYNLSLDKYLSLYMIPEGKLSGKMLYPEVALTLDEPGLEKLEYKMSEIKKTLYYEYTKLPKSIHLIDGPYITIYNFMYLN